MNISDFFLNFQSVISSVEPGNVIDIAIVTVLLYIGLIFIKQTRSFFMFASVIVIFGIVYVSREFNLGLTRQLFQPFLTFFFLIFVIVFQREIRRFFEWFSVQGRRFRMQKKISISEEVAHNILEVVKTLAQRKIGALIILAGDHPIEYALRGGLKTDSKVTPQILLNIFHKSNPSHDGAVIIRGNKIRYLGVHLPLAENVRVSTAMGTRHRAALGITEESDALAIVVSEERGSVSVAHDRSLHTVTNIDGLGKIISDYNKGLALGESERGVWHYLILSNWLEKVSALVFAVLLWFVFVFQANTITREFVVPIDFRFLPSGYVLESVTSNKVNLVLSGRNRDFDTLTDRQIGVFVDLSEAEPGRQRVLITEDNMNYPSYFSLESYSPESVTISVVGGVMEEGQ